MAIGSYINREIYLPIFVKLITYFVILCRMLADHKRLKTGQNSHLWMGTYLSGDNLFVVNPALRDVVLVPETFQSVRIEPRGMDIL